MALRLPVASHASEHDLRPAVAHRHRRQDTVARPTPGADEIRTVEVERVGGNTGVLMHNRGAEFRLRRRPRRS